MTTWNEPDNLNYGTKNQGETTRFVTRSGHVLGFSDEKGNEFVQLQHRSGNKIEMHPNGDVIVKSLKDNYQIVMGDNKILISGHQDITIQGGGSLKVAGDYDMRVSGNFNTVVEGNMETSVSGNHNTSVLGNQEVAVNGNQTTKVLGSMEHSADGKGYFAADGGVGIGSSGGNVEIEAAAEFNTTSEGDTKMVGANIRLNP